MMDLLNNSAFIGFLALAAVAVFASLRVIMHTNPVHAILAMIVSLLAVAGIFFILGAPFAGALEIIVYAGAILVLFVFVIMMLNLGMEYESQEESWLSADTWAIPTALTVIIALVLWFMITNDDDSAQALIGAATVSPKVVGTVLFSHYVLLVEIAALLLLGALVAAYHLGKKALNDVNTVPDSQYHASAHDLAQPNRSQATSQSNDYHYVDPQNYAGDAQAHKETH